jgi:hypothetical protein
VFEKTGKRIFDSLAKLSRASGKVAERSAGVYAEGLAQSSQLVSLQSYLMERWVDGGLSPLMQSLAAVQRDIADPLLDSFLGDRKLGSSLQEIGKRAASGARYRKLVHTLGKELFGSATFPGEEVIAETDLLRMYYLPARGAQDGGPALVHVGGFIPYGDRVFRFLPEANLFLPFLQRGIPVYAMEAKPGMSAGQLSDVTLEQIIDSYAELSGAAFRHHGGGKLLIEGYCGLGLPMLAYLAARPEEADAWFSTAMLMAAPVNVQACPLLGDMLARVPHPLLSTNLTLSNIFGRYLQGAPLRIAIDIPISTFFHKTRTGQFLTGWKRQDYADIEKVEDLNPAQRLELAGAYWISPKTFAHHPIPAPILRSFVQLWDKGLGPDLELPTAYKGEPIRLGRIVEKTRIRVAGFYGGEDRMIPDATADVLQDAFGDRYTHVVHEKAGHVSYIVVPAMWSPKLPFGFKPNPIDVALGV